MTITLGLELSKKRTLRASVIPYIVLGETIYFLLAQDKKSKQITDFGGGVKKYESSMSGALREFREESREIFEGTIYTCHNNKVLDIALIKDNMSVLFVPIDEKWYGNATSVFNSSNKKDGVFGEVSKIFWVSSDQFVNIFENTDVKNKMWIRLQRFYRSTYDCNVPDLLKNRYTNIYPKSMISCE